MANPALIYEVITDLDPTQLNDIGLKIYGMWLDFALGKSELGGNRLLHPTGRYASSIDYKVKGQSRVAIVADEKVAPEAAYLETGHGSVDLLEKLWKGKVYPIHRGTGGAAPQIAAGRGRSRIWASVRAGGFNGFARVPFERKSGARNTSGRGAAWTIPPMPAYSPAKILADLVAEMAKS